MDGSGETGREETNHVQPEEHAAQPSLTIKRKAVRRPAGVGRRAGGKERASPMTRVDPVKPYEACPPSLSTTAIDDLSGSSHHTLSEGILQFAGSAFDLHHRFRAESPKFVNHHHTRLKRMHDTHGPSENGPNNCLGAIIFVATMALPRMHPAMQKNFFLALATCAAIRSPSVLPGFRGFPSR